MSFLKTIQLFVANKRNYLFCDRYCTDVLPARRGETSPSDIADGLFHGAGIRQRPFPLPVRPVP